MAINQQRSQHLIGYQLTNRYLSLLFNEIYIFYDHEGPLRGNFEIFKNFNLGLSIGYKKLISKLQAPLTLVYMKTTR